MNAIIRHMTVQILVVTFTASAVLCAAIVLQQSVRFVDLIVNRGLPVSDFGYLALLMVPRFLAVVLPIAVFGATLFTYMRMQNGSELVVLRAAGMNSANLAKPGLIAAFWVMLISMVFSLYLMPLSSQTLRQYLFEARSALSSLLIKEGQFNVLRDDLTVYAREKAANGDILGILIHSKQSNGQKVTVMAERGALVESARGGRLLLVDGSQQTFEDGEVHKIDFDEYTFDLVEDDTAAEARWAEPRERFLPDLLFAADTPTNNHYRKKLVAEGHNRILQPIMAMSYTMLALYFLLNSTFTRRGQSKPLGYAVASMVTLLVLNLSLVSGASKSSALIIPMYLTAFGPILFGFIALVLPKKHKRRTRAEVLGADPQHEPVGG